VVFLAAHTGDVFMAITLTELAAKQIKDIIQQQNLPAGQTKLRVGVKGGGCSGFSYMLDLTEEAAAETDEELESNGVPILIDSKSLLYLEGTEIDFKDDVMQSGFVFKNPNATSTCGCGSSFQA
jgi:iron-sulfur cluster assembly protein